MPRSHEKLAIAVTAALLVTAVASLYIGTTSHVLGASHDSIEFITRIDSGDKLFNPHHLIYNYLGAIWLSSARSLGVERDSMLIVPLLNSVFGAMTIGLFYLILRLRLQLPNIWALVGSCLPALSFGFWFYSVNIEVYVIPICFMVACVLLLSAEKLTPLVCVGIGVCHALATLTHQVHLLFGLAVCAGLILHARQGFLSFRRLFTFYVLPAGLGVAVPYLWVMFVHLRLPSLSSAWAWLTGYANYPDYWNVPSLLTLSKALIGSGHSLIGGYFLFASEWSRNWLQSTLPNKHLTDEVFLVRNMWSSDAIVYSALTALLIVAVFLLVWRGLSSLRAAWKKNTVLVVVTLVFVGSYSVFFFFYEPSNLEFWISQSVGVWLLLMTIWSPQYTPKPDWKLFRIITPALVALLFVVNYGGGIRYLHNRNNDYFYNKVAPLRALTQPGDLVVTWSAWMFPGYVRRYVTSNVASLVPVYEREQSFDALMAKSTNAIERTLHEGKKVIILAEAVEPQLNSDRTDSVRLARVEQLWRPYRDRLEKVGSGGNEYFILAPYPSPSVAADPNKIASSSVPSSSNH